MKLVTSQTQPLRERVLSAVTLWFAVGGCVNGAVLAIQAWKRSETDVYLWIAVFGGPVFGVLKLVQSLLGYRLSASLFLAQLFLLTAHVHNFRSLTPGTVSGQIALLLLSGLFFGARGVVWAFLASLSTFALSAGLVLHGVLTPWHDSYWDPREPLVWLRYAFVLGCFGGGLCTAFVLMIDGLERTAARLHATLTREREERRQRETAQSALEKSKRFEALGQLAAGVAHDFNNSLMVIIGGASVLRADPSARPDVVALAEQIIERAHTGANTVEQLLSLGRPNGGHVEAVTLDGVLRRSVRTLQQALSEHVQLDLACAWQGLVRIDVGRFQQALLNLATNARDAMPNGGRWTLRVAEHELDHVPGGWEAQPGRFVALECSDTGVGLDGDVVDRMFEPFFSTKASGTGTGLGLVMVRKTIVEAGGFIEVESTYGAGTTFRLFLPVHVEHGLRDG